MFDPSLDKIITKVNQSNEIVVKINGLFQIQELTISDDYFRSIIKSGNKNKLQNDIKDIFERLSATIILRSDVEVSQNLTLKDYFMSVFEANDKRDLELLTSCFIGNVELAELEYTRFVKESGENPISIYEYIDQIKVRNKNI